MRWEIDIRKTLGSGASRFALDISFTSDVSRLVLYGPSGAGKSVTLKAIAGLLRPDSGRICVDGEILFDTASAVDVAAERRRFGYVFQEYALFPHLTVRQNIAFGLRRAWVNPRRDVASATVDRWLDALELRPFATRHPDELSGGQRQRTALARALVAEPRALLLDEPFAALDSGLRGRLRAELGELQARLGLPLVLITHDADDVDLLADEVVHIDAGRVVAAAIAATQRRV